ncbi:hypothetical protein GCK72_005298 [Caenorhabditis remanei]|uniref:Major sperm protein n=1 Tax=Caenorhabditis remanei TaxID=31234 RepID=A0A6A5HF57_CAERE|nr:hypothetical protein GCK72_005298 [Caenorhabditis remanei]KAF1765346.1 hypothetical protein GCK72_005298 [Caenorhabditis remanei]
MSLKMALGTNGKRSIRSDIDNAAGDNNINFGVKKSYEESSLNLQMAERQTVIGKENHPGENRYFGGLVGNKEIFVMTMIAVALYLIEGEHAKFVCTALTSVPPAIFSYKVLMNSNSTKEGYHSILFYWTIYGLLAVLDQFVGSPQGYNLIKGGLLGSVFLHSFRSNPHAFPIPWNTVDQTTGGMLTSIFTKYDSQGFIQKTESSAFDPRSPTITQFSSDDESEYMPTLLENELIDVSTACSFQPSLPMQSTQTLSPDFVYKTAVAKTTPIENEDGEPCSTIRIHYKKPSENQFETMSAMTMTCGGVADIVTVPSDRISFNYQNQEVLIQITNVSPLHIMFALKTNANTHLIAAPTTGILLSGQSMKMRVGVTNNFFRTCTDPGAFIDKLAIDYASIPQHYSSSISKFSPEFFQSHNRRRHAIRVFYQ